MVSTARRKVCLSLTFVIVSSFLYLFHTYHVEVLPELGIFKQGKAKYGLQGSEPDVILGRWERENREWELYEVGQCQMLSKPWTESSWNLRGKRALSWRWTPLHGQHIVWRETFF